MHIISQAQLKAGNEAIDNCWMITAGDLNRLAKHILGGSRENWVRDGLCFGLIAGRKYGSVANKIPAEMNELCRLAKIILEGGAEPEALRAVVFFHLRFLDGIHPLHDGNGRVARCILARQLGELGLANGESFLTELAEKKGEYRNIFWQSTSPEMMFELMIDLLARMIGVALPRGTEKLPFSLGALYPDRRPLIVSGTRFEGVNPTRRQNGKFYGKWR